MAETPKKAAAAPVAGKTRVGATAGSGDQGPGTGQPQADADTLQRGQARMHVGAGHEAAPIEAPDAANQADPEEGHGPTSTNPVAANSALTSVAGEDHVRLVGEDGQEISPDDIFEDADPSKTFRITKTRVYEEFHYWNSPQPMTRLLFPAGWRVDLATAANLAQAQQLAQAQTEADTVRAEQHAEAFHGAS